SRGVGALPPRHPAAGRRAGPTSHSSPGPVTQSLRVFVNERPVDVPRGATVRDAVGSFDRALAELLATESAYVTDARGLPVEATDAIAEAGAVFRVVVRAQRGPRQ